MKKIALIVGAMFALAIALGCGSSDNTKKDTTVVKKDGKTNPQLDTGVNPTSDGPVTKKDTKGTPTGDAGACTTGLTAKSNSGTTCTSTGKCTSADEVCVGMKNAAGQTVGMCLGKCCVTTQDPNDPNFVCPVTDSAKQFAVCNAILKNGGMSCVWVCETTDGTNTVKFSCPDDTNYDCIVVFSNTTDKFCVPKK
jgi:hypothetical protein